MTRTNLLSVASKMLFGGLILSSQPALALQPLGDFVVGAREHAFDAREQRDVVTERAFQAEAARGRLLPSFLAQGVFTHNQFEAGIPAGTFPGQEEALTITPQNQWDATFKLNVPLVDLSNYARFRQAKHLRKAAEQSEEAIGSDLDHLVAQYYFTYVGASALMDAAERSVKIAQENLAYVSTRFELGAATELDKERASANLEQAKQDNADAELIGITVGRNLETLTGISAKKVTEYPIDSLQSEAPLKSWMEQKNTPYDRVQRELSLAAVQAKKASSYALMPTLSANAQERISNATGFAGQAAAYSLSAVLSWNIDYSTYSQAQAGAAAARQQAIRAERTRRAAEDTVFNSYHRVRVSIIKSRSARAQADSSSKAAALAMERYQAGAVTQLDVTQSQRDAFQAQAGRIKADADLFLARVLLRLAAGLPPHLPASPTKAPPN